MPLTFFLFLGLTKRQKDLIFGLPREAIQVFRITTGGFSKLRGWGTTPIDRLHGGGVIWAEHEGISCGAENSLVIRVR